MNGKHLILTALAFALIGAAPPAAGHSEPGRQGETMPDDLKTPVLPEPYSKGVRIVGHAELGQHRDNLIMAWSGHCAYVANDPGNPIAGAKEAAGASPTSGVAVIDVHNPAAPKTVGYLQNKGALEAAETMHAVTTARRAVLAASTNISVVAAIVR